MSSVDAFFRLGIVQPVCTAPETPVVLRGTCRHTRGHVMVLTRYWWPYYGIVAVMTCIGGHHLGLYVPEAA